MEADKKSLRRQQILEAALECFMQYGYAKTAFDDVARKAEVSRSLLYTYFKDKNHLFISVAQDLLDEQRRKTEAILKSGDGDQQRFSAVLELWGVDLYARAVADSPHGRELLEEGLRAWEEIGVKYKEYLNRALTRFVGDPDVAELVTLSIKGFQSDHPSVPVLRKRINLLAELSWKGKARS